VVRKRTARRTRLPRKFMPEVDMDELERRIKALLKDRERRIRVFREFAGGRP